MVKKFSEYLNFNNIPFTKDFNSNIERQTMVYINCDSVPGDIIESCIWSYVYMPEIRVYFSKVVADICKTHTGNHMALSIFSVIIGKFSAEQAIDYLKKISFKKSLYL